MGRRIRKTRRKTKRKRKTRKRIKKRRRRIRKTRRKTRRKTKRKRKTRRKTRKKTKRKRKRRRMRKKRRRKMRRRKRRKKKRKKQLLFNKTQLNQLHSEMQRDVSIPMNLIMTVNLSAQRAVMVSKSHHHSKTKRRNERIRKVHFSLSKNLSI